jgi:hypothetical protein
MSERRRGPPGSEQRPREGELPLRERDHAPHEGEQRAREGLAESPHGHGGAHPPAEQDRIRSRTIVAVGVASLVVFLVASLVVVAGLRRQQRQLLPDGPRPLPAELGKSKIGIVEQRLFEHSNQAQATSRVQRRKLETYGWVDPAQGVVRLPVERGMQLVIEGQRPVATPPAPGAAPPERPAAPAPPGRAAPRGGAEGPRRTP